MKSYKLKPQKRRKKWKAKTEAQNKSDKQKTVMDMVGVIP